MTVLVDTSVWIGHLRDHSGKDQDVLAELLRDGDTGTTDVVLLEVLAGPTGEDAAHRLRQFLAGATYLRQESPADVEQAASLYRTCRRAGETPRSLLDCLVAAVAVRNDVPVLHRDRDFDVLARHTDLRVVTP